MHVRPLVAERVSSAVVQISDHMDGNSQKNYCIILYAVVHLQTTLLTAVGDPVMCFGLSKNMTCQLCEHCFTIYSSVDRCHTALDKKFRFGRSTRTIHVLFYFVFFSLFFTFFRCTTVHSPCFPGGMI